MEKSNFADLHPAVGPCLTLLMPRTVCARNCVPTPVRQLDGMMYVERKKQDQTSSPLLRKTLQQRTYHSARTHSRPAEVRAGRNPCLNNTTCVKKLVWFNKKKQRERQETRTTIIPLLPLLPRPPPSLPDSLKRSSGKCSGVQRKKILHGSFPSRCLGISCMIKFFLFWPLLRRIPLRAAGSECMWNVKTFLYRHVLINN